MAEFSVDKKVLMSTGDKLIGYSGDYDAISRNMREIATGMGNAYSAADNLKFVERIEAFCVELKTMASKVENAGKNLKAASERYEKREDENTGIASKLPGRG